jgi:hypothetical protein
MTRWRGIALLIDSVRGADGVRFATTVFSQAGPEVVAHVVRRPEKQIFPSVEIRECTVKPHVQRILGTLKGSTRHGVAWQAALEPQDKAAAQL